MPSDLWKRFMQERGSNAARQKPVQPQPLELVAQAIASKPGWLLRGHLNTLGLDIDDDGNLYELPNGRAKIVGFSREGVARVSKHEDLAAVREAEKGLMDRLYGKPRQAMELAADSGAAAVILPNNPERNRSVAAVLMEAGAVKAEVSADGEVDADHPEA